MEGVAGISETRSAARFRPMENVHTTATGFLETSVNEIYLLDAQTLRNLGFLSQPGQL